MSDEQEDSGERIRQHLRKIFDRLKDRRCAKEKPGPAGSGGGRVEVEGEHDRSSVVGDDKPPT